MNIFQSIKTAVKNVFGNKMRAALTMLGIIIGIGSVIMITSIGEGSTAQITSQFDKMGAGRTNIRMQSGDDTKESDYLTMKDYGLLKDNPKIE
ncbi:hypothetical protein AGMMS49975_19870 [Clostridia bacterium]|nr:hypothetical protein AGMMS49975_19870 [Clostridia bacterium]